MMELPRILVQLDSDSHPSVFDGVVAIDAGVSHLFQYGQVEPTNVRQLVHGAMFTRGPSQLHRTAVFVGGSSVSVGEEIGAEIRQAFFGPIRVSVMLDGNGSNTTSAAAVLCAARHAELAASTSLILGGTGPVGQRVARLLLRQNATVLLASRDLERAQATCRQLEQRLGRDACKRLTPVSFGASDEQAVALERCNLLFGCGAAGATLLNSQTLNAAPRLTVAIDLNAVPPTGIEGIAVTDKAVARGGRVDYGAIGVGGLKMKIHRESIQCLFSRNDLFLDAEEIYEIGRQLEEPRVV